MKRSDQQRQNRFRKSSNRNMQTNDLMEFDETNGDIESIKVCSPQNRIRISDKVKKQIPKMENFSGEGESCNERQYEKTPIKLSGGGNNLLNYAKKLKTEGIQRHTSLQNYINFTENKKNNQINLKKQTGKLQEDKMNIIGQKVKQDQEGEERVNFYKNQDEKKSYTRILRSRNQGSHSDIDVPIQYERNTRHKSKNLKEIKIDQKSQLESVQYDQSQDQVEPDAKYDTRQPRYDQKTQKLNTTEFDSYRSNSSKFQEHQEHVEQSDEDLSRNEYDDSIEMTPKIKKSQTNDNWNSVSIGQKQPKNQKLSGISQILKQGKGAGRSGIFSSMYQILQSKGMTGDSMFKTSLNKSSGGNFNDLEQEMVKSSDMRSVFQESYGLEMDFPGYYYSNSKFVPREAKSKYCIVLAWHIIPSGQHKKVQTTKIDKTYQFDPFEDLYSTKGKDMILKLMRPLKTGVFETHMEIQLKEIQQCFIEFSRQGNLLGMYIEKTKQLRIYDARDIKKCIQNIENNKMLYKFDIDDPQFDVAHRIVFDLQERFVAIVTKVQIVFKCLAEEKKRKEIPKFIIGENHEEILDVIVDSKGSKTKITNCTVACRQDSGRKIIEIFNIYDEDTSDMRCILFQTDKSKIQVKISDDCEQVMFSNQDEHYILKGKSQDFFPQLGKKTIRHCTNYKKQFYFVVSQEYDRDCDIQCSDSLTFNASIVRSFEPGQLHVFDTHISMEDEDKRKGKMIILMNQGDYLYLDTIDLQLANNDEKRSQAHVSTCIDKMYMAYAFNWPYFSYTTKYNYTFILNAFNGSFIQRYELPRHTVRCSAAFLADTHDYYCMIETLIGYELYNIDLDSMEPYLNGPLLQYTFESVQNQPLTGFQVRASSRKEKINLNKALICFLMHKNLLYGWCESEGNIVTPVNQVAQDPDPTAYCSNFYYLSDDMAFYMTTKETRLGKKKVLHSHIKLVEASFGNYKVSDIYEDKDQRAEILNFGVDNTRQRLMILTGIKNRKGKRDKYLSIYCLKHERIMLCMLVENQELIGRLKSNLYNLVGGHIYYNNKVIKIRYDVIDHSEEAWPENQVFDNYQNVLYLGANDYVQPGTPLQTCLYNKLAYIIGNQVNLKSRKVLIMPYLHERRIYLNRRHTTNQFYTLCRHQSGITLILCLCIQDNKMYIYTETGILVDRVGYEHLAEKYGKPIEISENGLILIFQKSNESSEIHLIQVHIDKLEWVATIDVKKSIEKYLSGASDKHDEKSLTQMRAFYKNHLRTLDEMKYVQMTFCLNDDAEILVRLKPKVPETVLTAFAKQVAKKYLDNQPEFEEAQISHKTEECSFFYFFPNPNIEKSRANCIHCFGCSKLGQAIENQRDPDDPVEEEENYEFIYFDNYGDEINDLRGISMNQDFVFYWNTGNVWKFNLFEQKLTRIGLYVDERQLDTFIIQVRTGSDKTRVAVRVTQTKTMDCIIIWDLAKDIEIESFDVRKDAMFFQDRWGNQYLAENDYIINCEQTCKLKSYKMDVKDFEEPQFKFGNGYRVDDEMHNFILMRNFINLSFSYMTFVIKDNFDQGGYISNDFLFDSEGYDFVLGKNTLFTEGTLVTQDYDKLLFILKSYEKEDPVLLEQLLYKNSQNKTPLHIAVKANNTRMVNLILQFLAKNPNSGISVLKDIFKDLIDFQDFSTYLLSSPFQTVQMLYKQTIMLKNADSNEIVRVSPSRCSYVDDTFFENVMGEDKEKVKNQTYAINMKCIRADWILQDEQGLGLVFMVEMLRKKNREVFMTPYMQIIIQFLYEAYSKRIMVALLPPYLFHLIFVNIQLFANETMRDTRYQLEQLQLTHGEARPDEIVALDTKYNNIKNFSDVVVIICGICNILNSIVFFMQSKSLGMQVFVRIWSIVDFAIIVTNFITLVNVYINFGTQRIRIIEAVLILCMWFKSMYYMRLVTEIAPLVESIFVIMNDMFYFLIIFFIGIVAFSEAFFIIGKNQVMLTQDQADYQAPSYASIQGALMYGYMQSLGELDPSEYGDNEMTPFLKILFVLLSLFMCIHLLNMLIAIMGQSFDENAEIAESNRKISQLEFVVNNWWIHPIKDKNKIIYFVAAFNVLDEDASDSKLDLIVNTLSDVQNQLKNQFREIKHMQYEISQLQNNQK